MKNLKNNDNRAAVEQWRTKVALNTIRTVSCQANPVSLIKSRKPVSGRPMKLSIDQEGGMAKY
jgi:hypothetical protein